MTATSQMTDAARALLDAFDEAHRARAHLPFPTDDERRRWFYTPTDHGGVPLGQLTPPQQQTCMKLVAAGLSEPGYVTAATILALENILDRVEGWPGGGGRRGRDPLAYCVTVFGDPGDAMWGWRFGGHHISLNFTIVDGRIASTPLFFGADPAASPLADGVTLRPLGPVEDRARELVRSLDDKQRDAAIVSPVPPLDIVMGNRSRVVDGALPLGLWEIFRDELPAEGLRSMQSAQADELGLRDEHLEALRYTDEPKGLPGASMTSEQRECFSGLIARYVRRAAGDVASSMETDLHEQLDEMHFAWAGTVDFGEPHYYRVQGPRLLIEYDNVQRGANHAHSVMRDPTDDFGDDLLRQHHAQHHSN